MLRMLMFYSRDFHVWFRGYTARIKETLLTLRVGRFNLKVIRENFNQKLSMEVIGCKVGL